MSVATCGPHNSSPGLWRGGSTWGFAGRKGQGIVLILIRTGILAQSGFSHGLDLPGTYLTGRERGCFVE